MKTHTVDGATLLTTFADLMAQGDRRAACAYRDRLSPSEREAFYLTLRNAWIPCSVYEPCEPWTVVSLPAPLAEDRVQMIRDITLICAAHDCSLQMELDENSGALHMLFDAIPASVRKVLLAWMRGYTQPVFGDTSASVLLGACSSTMVTVSWQHNLTH
jgi:hypothetical protein